MDELALRPVAFRDARLLRRWANDDATRQASFSPTRIGRREHRKWLRQRLDDPESRLWLGMLADESVGVIRFEPCAEGAKVSVVIARAHRGQGIGSRLIGEGTRRFRSEFNRLVVAEIRPENHASKAAFEAAGYSCVSADEQRCRFVYPGGGAMTRGGWSGDEGSALPPG